MAITMFYINIYNNDSPLNITLLLTRQKIIRNNLFMERHMTGDVLLANVKM